jgi:hypothetical protein
MPKANSNIRTDTCPVRLLDPRGQSVKYSDNIDRLTRGGRRRLMLGLGPIPFSAQLPHSAGREKGADRSGLCSSRARDARRTGTECPSAEGLDELAQERPSFRLCKITRLRTPLRRQHASDKPFQLFKIQSPNTVCQESRRRTPCGGGSELGPGGRTPVTPPCHVAQTIAE